MTEELDLEELAPWLVAVITLIGGGLRILLLDTKGMWLDETFSVWLANHGIAELLQWSVKIDQHPPLYYLLLHAWIALGKDTPYHVRLLSVLFGAGAIPMIYLIGKRMSGALTGLAAAMFLALSPFNIRYAQEARMYTLLTFNAAVAIYALVRLLTDARSGRPIGSQFREYLRAWRTPGPVEPEAKKEFSYQVEPQNLTGWRGWLSRRPPIRIIETDLAWTAFVVFSAATLLTHNTAVLFVLAANIFVLGLLLVQKLKKPGSPPGLQAPPWRSWVQAQIGILLLWSPWSLAFIRQASRVDQEFWIPKPTWDIVIEALKALLNAPTPTPNQASQGMIVWIPFVLVLGLGLLHYRKKMARFLFLAALFAIPFLGELIVSIRRPIFYDRTLIWITIPLILLLAAGIAQLRFRFLMIIVVGILGTANLFAASDYFRFMYKENWSIPAGYVANFAQQDDLILFNSNFVIIPFNYYFEAWEQQYSLQVVKRGVPLDLFDHRVLEPKMTPDDVPGLISLVSGRKRVWLVYSHDSYTDPSGLVPQTLASKMKLTRQRDGWGGTVQLYEAP